jgi:hypothetical protein
MSATFERDLLAGLAARWGRRVAVKQDELDLDGHFDADLPDFPEHLVPVLGVPGLPELEPEARSRIGSAAWIAYNAKTSAIEDEIILPACRLMLSEHIGVRKDEVAVAALHQTIIDEHYHILMCHNAVGVTRRRRDLTDLAFDPKGWAVVQGLDRERAGLAGHERDLVEIAFALAAETTINAFLSTLSTASDIQPMNRITVDMHRKDESGHAVIFRELVGQFYRRLGADDQNLFKHALVQGMRAFRAADVEPWIRVGLAADVAVTPEQLARVRPSGTGPGRDTGPLQVLLADLGLTEELLPMLTSDLGN